MATVGVQGLIKSIDRQLCVQQAAFLIHNLFVIIAWKLNYLTQCI